MYSTLYCFLRKLDTGQGYLPLTVYSANDSSIIRASFCIKCIGMLIAMFSVEWLNIAPI